MDLQQVESLCQKIYGQRSSPEDRKSAHEELLFLQTSASYVDQCIMILSQSKDLPTLMFACQSLNLVMKRDWSNIPPQTRYSLQQFLVEKVAAHAAAFDSRHFLTRKLIQTLCQLTRRAWCEDARVHGLVDFCLFWMSQKRTDLALRVMGDLVSEFDQAKSQSAFGEDSSRRAFQSFRELEGGLFRVFSTCVELVWASAQLLPHSQPVLCESLRCLVACLSFDFAGTGSGDSESGNFSGQLVASTVYLPKQWIPMIGNEKSITDLFHLYSKQFQEHRDSALSEEIGSLVLQCLALVAGIRRTPSVNAMSHVDATRNAPHVYAMLRGVEHLCQTRLGFADSEECLHNFCRLLGRVRVAPQQLAVDSELALYYDHQYLPCAREFSMHCLVSWLTVSPHSVAYLFEFWKSVAHVQLDARKKCALLRPLVFTYVESRMTMCEVAANGGSSPTMREALRAARECRLASDTATASCDLDEIDPLQNEEVLLDEIASICNFVSGGGGESGQHEEDVLLEGIGQVLDLGGVDDGVQAKKAFAMYFVGCLLSVRESGSGTADEQHSGGEIALCAKAFKAVSDATVPVRAERYEQAILYFLQCFHYMLLESKTRAQVSAQELKLQQTRRYMRLSSLPPPSSGSSSPDIMPALLPVRHAGLSHQQQQRPSLAIDDFYVRSSGGGASSSYLKPLTMKRSNSTLMGGVGSVAASGGGLDDMLAESRLTPPNSSSESGGGDNSMFSTGSEDAMQHAELLAQDYAKSQSVTRRISELLGLPPASGSGGSSDELVLMNLAMQHVLNVLMQPRASREEETALVERALGVLKQLVHSSSVVVSAVSAIPKMVKSGTLFLDLDFVQNLLRNATPDVFPLLTETATRGKSRTAYMSILAFLFFLQLDASPPSAAAASPTGASVLSQSERVDDAFCQFMLPMSQQHRARGEPCAFLRDVRGVFQSATEFHQYELCFAWLFTPGRLLLLRECASMSDNAEVCTALLKLLVEVASNRDARIAFPASSTGPALLVTECVQMVQPLCQRMWDDVTLQLRAQEAQFVDLWNKNHSALSSATSSASAMSMSSLHALVEELGQESAQENKDRRRGHLPVRFKQGVVGMGFTLEHDAKRTVKPLAQICLLLTKLGKLCPSVQFRDLQHLVLQLVLSCDPVFLSGFAKLEQHFVGFCYHVSETQPMLLVGLAPPAFARLVAVLALAVQPKAALAASMGGILSTHAAYTIETLAAMRSRAVLFSLMPFTQNTSLDLDAYYCLRPGQGFVKSELSMLHRVHRQSARVYPGRDLQHCLQCFSVYETQEPYLFPDLLHSLLERVLTVSESELTNLYAMTRPLLALAGTNQQAVKAFSDAFVGTQAMSRQRATADQLMPVLRLLTVDSTQPLDMCEYLRRQDEFTKDLCKAIRRFRDFYSAGGGGSS